jgi:hypothetical protein
MLERIARKEGNHGRPHNVVTGSAEAAELNRKKKAYRVSGRDRCCLRPIADTERPLLANPTRKELTVHLLAVGGVESPGSVSLSVFDARPNWCTRSVRLPFRMRTDARLTSPMAPPSSSSSPADLERPIF